MKQKVEFVCKCGRSYILFVYPGKPQKCPRCARVMKSSIQQKETKKDEKISVKPKVSMSFGYPDETREYQYTFDQDGQWKSRSEPFTLGKLLKKIWTLFSPRRTGRY